LQLAGLYKSFVFFGLAMLVGQLMFEVWSIVFEVNAERRRVKVIRLQSTGLPPDLTLRERHNYHLFASRKLRLCIESPHHSTETDPQTTIARVKL
jgi:hypothetical protein